MPTSEAPSKLNEQPEPTEGGVDSRSAEEARQARMSVGGSRWVDYDTHELLEMISELEDERRWARLREGVLWAVLFHILLLFGLFLIPKYLLRMVPAVDDTNIKNQKDFTYLDSPYVSPPKPVKPLLRQPQIDKKTLEEMKREEELKKLQAPPAPAQQAPPPPQQAPEEAKPQPAPPIPPQQQSPSQAEAPKPAAVPAKPNFAQLSQQSQNPSDQLQQAMRDAARNRGAAGQPQLPGGLAQHPGAGTGGVQILSDTQGVNFSAWLTAWYYETRRTWDPLIPEEVNPPISKQGQVMVRFKVLPNGRIMDGSMTLEGRSGDSALDRAAWGALIGSSYPPLPRDFHGPYLELRALFLYNMQPPQ